MGAFYEGGVGIDGPSDGSTFHDLGKLYPNAPIPNKDGLILRNATIDDPNGLVDVMNWVSQGDIVILDVSPVIDNEDRLNQIINPLMVLVENQIGGELLNFGRTRLLILPNTHTVGFEDGA
tara:strand:+ start:431 stop:793 length:363 start_codon:yes stop_codon:yes gene_type:complete